MFRIRDLKDSIVYIAIYYNVVEAIFDFVVHVFNRLGVHRYLRLSLGGRYRIGRFIEETVVGDT